MLDGIRDRFDSDSAETSVLDFEFQHDSVDYRVVVNGIRKNDDDITTQIGAVTIYGGVFDGTAPSVEEVAPVSTYTNDATPDVVIKSDQDGDVTYGGSCIGDQSTITAATNTTITLSSDGSGRDLSDGTYSDCTITVTNSANDVSEALTLRSFTVDTTNPVAWASTSGLSNAGETGTLDGTRSRDTGGSGIASYAWIQVDGFGNTPLPPTDEIYVTLTNANTAQATFTVPSLPTGRGLTFKLTVTDNAGNRHTNQVSYNVNPDRRPRATTVTLGSSNTDTTVARNGDTVTLAFTTDEDLSVNTPQVALVDAGGNTLASGDATGSGTSWSFSYTLDGTESDGAITFSITMTGAGGTRTQTELVNDPDGGVTIDTTAPSVVISAPAEARGPFTATFTFSESVTGFELGDITVGNGTASDLNFNAAGNVYTATITPTEHGTVTLDVAAAVAIDGAGNNNTAADQVSVEYDNGNYIRQRTQRIISNFMTRRGDAITSNQPDYTERLNQGGAEAGDADASFTGEGSYANNRMNLSASLRQMLSANKAKKDQRLAELGEQMKLGLQSKGTQSLGLRNLATNDGAPAGFDLWIRGRWARYENDTNQGDLGLLFIGADYKFNDSLVIGVVGQFDWTDEVDDTDEFKIRGKGWMVGPYW